MISSSSSFHPELEETSLVDMSNSELFQVEKDVKVIEFNILLRSTLEFSSDTCLLASSLSKHYISSSSSSSSSSVSDEETMKISSQEARTKTLGGELEVDEDDDGFRTPTSLDHRIPVIQQCPPAPRKPKSSPKRKASSSSSSSSPSSTRRQIFLLDLSQEIESLFPPAFLADLGRKIKKVRGAEDDTK